MLAELYYPTEPIFPEQLDDYLERGWFRMGQSIFTTNFLKFNGVFYSAIWLRVDLLTFTPTKTQQKIKKQNAKFRVEIVPTSPDLSPEQLILFNKYKSSVPFDTSPSLSHLLYDNGYSNVYDSYEICVYDHQKLIACGIIDLGKNSSEGIVCFYDPDYKKYSLGKYLMLLKIEFCKKRGMGFFYPGYFAPNYPMFDYKLDLSDSSMEFLELSTNQWQSISNFVPTETPLIIMTQRLEELSECLKKRNFEHTFMHYEYFDADIAQSLNGLGLFDFPVFIFCFEVGISITNPLIIYDIVSSQYHLVLCDTAYRLDNQIQKENVFNSHLLQMTQHLFATESMEAMALVVAKSLQKV
ncbi:MAG: arginyl-tRNA--protein arginylyltransferase [Bacteroidota bacterium]